jgi:hypothetical protein
MFVCQKKNSSNENALLSMRASSEFCLRVKRRNPFILSSRGKTTNPIYFKSTSETSYCPYIAALYYKCMFDLDYCIIWPINTSRTWATHVFGPKRLSRVTDGNNFADDCFRWLLWQAFLIIRNSWLFKLEFAGLCCTFYLLLPMSASLTCRWHETR